MNSRRPSDLTIETHFRTLRSFARLACAGVLFLAVTTLAGWGTNTGWLKSFGATVAMNPTTAVLFLLSAVALLVASADRSPQRTIPLLLGAIITLVAGGIWLRHVSGVDIGLDRILLLARSGAEATSHQMAPATSLSFVLCGLSILLLRVETRRGFYPAQVFVIPVGVIALSALLGYGYQRLALYRPSVQIPVALNTAAAFLLLSAAMLCVQPKRGLMAVLTSRTAGGSIARRLLPAAVLIPAVLGALRLLGERRRFYNSDEGISLFIVANIFVFALFIWWTARALYRFDLKRQRAETRLKLQYTTTRVLSEAANPCEAIPGVLKAVCETLGWQVGAMWEVDPRSNFVNCIDVWRSSEPRLEEFETITRQATFPRGVGLPGRVWEGGAPTWIADVVNDGNFPRAPMAQQVGLHGALGFPIKRAGEVLGVMEFFSGQIEQPDEELLQLLSAIGAQIGQFVQRTQMERALRDSEALYHSLVETLPVNILRKDLEGHITFGNKRYAETIGRPMSELLGKTDADLFPPDLARKYVEDDRRVIETGEVFEDIEAHLRAGGEPSYVQVLKAPVLDARGKVVGTQTIFWDVTARKQAEQSLEQTAQELARSNRELEQFAYVASHDLQEPLRMIAAYTQLLQRRYKDKLDKDANEFIGYAVDGALRMQKLIQDLLTYSRVGTRTKPFERVRMEDALSAAMANLQIAIAESAAAVTHDPLPRVNGDMVQLVQLFQNLLSNAIKFRGTEPLRIHISAEAREHQWLFAVRDNGIGIDPQYFRRIFIIFQRLHTQQEYPGTGIGLAVCKKIVERHGGRMWVESEPGKGSAFFFTMPLLKD
jgi:PAS domain S-box-containing protein